MTDRHGVVRRLVVTTAQIGGSARISGVAFAVGFRRRIKARFGHRLREERVASGEAGVSR